MLTPGHIQAMTPESDGNDVFRLWLGLAAMSPSRRRFYSRAIVLKECLPDPEAELVFESGELLV